MKSQDSNSNDELRRIEEAMESPSLKGRLDSPVTRKVLFWGLVLLVVVSIVVLRMGGGDSDDEEIPDRENLAKPRVMLDDPNASPREKIQGFISPVIGTLTGEKSPSGPQLSPEEIARREYLRHQTGGSLRVELNPASFRASTRSGSGMYPQSGYAVSGGGVSAITGANVPGMSGYGKPTVSDITATVRPKTLWHNENRILEGKRMAAILETPIDTSLPGPVRVIFTEDVYSESGDRILIPRYSEGLGMFGNVRIQSGQDRVAIIYHRLLLRTGKNDGIVEVRLDSPATDALGRSGVKGNVKTHFWARFGNALLYTLIGTTASNVADARSGAQNAQQAYLESTTDAFRETAQESLREQDVHEPTITVPRATPITIVAAKDILFGDGQVEGVR